MSTSPYFNKAASYGAHQTPYSSQSTFYTGQQQLTPRQSELKHISSPLLGSKYINRESQLHQVHQKYEKEAQKVNTNYVKHYQKQLEFNDSANHVQEALDLERKRCATLEARLDECFREMDQHKRQKLELARESAELREILRRKEGLLADSEQKLIHVQENANGVNFENDGFRHEMRKLSETYTAKLKEVEEKYKAEIREFNEELDRLRSQIKEQDIDVEAKVRGISRDLEAKVRSLENQLREKDRIINETTHEIGSLKEYNVKIKMEYEEELRRQLAIVKERERVQFEAPTKDLENRLRALEVEKDTIEKKIPELKNEIKDKEKTIKELKTRAQDQLGGLRRENIALNDQISEMGSEIERLQSELVGKDSGIAKLHTEIRNLNLEVGHQKEYYLPEIERLVAKNNEDIKRFQDYERNLKARIMELERMLKVSDAESGKLKVDIERLKVQTAGNVHKAISEIFGDYGTANLQGRPAF